MNRLIHQKNNHNFNQKLIQSTKHQKFTSNKTYANVLSTLTKIFDAAGQSHVLHLAKLRKLWHTGIDSFLSKNAYPRNISVDFKIFINTNFIHELEQTKLTLDLFQTIEKMKGKNFSRLEQFIGYLGKKVRRPISDEEMELLKRIVLFNPTRNILYLTVYDGSISHAIHMETETYLRIFNKLLPEIKLDEIHCHVGEIEKVKLDQGYVASLAKNWHLITPAKIHLKCMPAFFHRVSQKQVVLILYVSSLQDLDFLKFNLGVDSILKILLNEFPDLRGVLKNIKFVHVEQVDLEKIRWNSIIQGGIPMESYSNKGGTSKSIPVHFSKKFFDAKKEFAKISKKLKSK